MKKVLLAECKQEVSTFNPRCTEYDDFMIFRTTELLARYEGAGTELSGALSVLQSAENVEVFPAYGACFKTCGGPLSTAAWERIRSEFTASLQEAPPIDGIYFSMHGAMASVDEVDPEGVLIETARAILGEDIPIVVSLDLHGIPTRKIFQAADAVVAFQTYPHVDLYETGKRAAELLLRILFEGVRPVTARVPIPALVRGDELITATGSIRHAMNQAMRVEQSAPGLSAGLFIGNPFTDVPELQSYSFVVTDGELDQAVDAALEIASRFWEHHETMVAHLMDLEDAVNELKSIGGGTVAVVDAADATSSGASGDSNAVLRAMVDLKYEGRALIPIVDPAAASAAAEAGVGSSLRLPLGGAIDQARFAPLMLDVTVRCLSDGRMVSESFGDPWDSGLTAVLEAGNFVVIAMTRPVHLFDRTLFFAHGQDPRRFDAVVVKSPHCQPHMYADWCAKMIHVDAPGSTSANLKSLGHIRCPRPIFPLDPIGSFNPEAMVFCRQSGNP